MIFNSSQKKKKTTTLYVLTLTRTFFFFLALSFMLSGLFFWAPAFSAPPVLMLHLRPPNSSMAWASVGPSYLPSSWQKQTHGHRERERRQTHGLTQANFSWRPLIFCFCVSESFHDILCVLKYETCSKWCAVKITWSSVFLRSLGKFRQNSQMKWTDKKWLRGGTLLWFLKCVRDTCESWGIQL